MNEFLHLFEDLPLATVGEIECGYTSGEAVISYDRSGQWEIGEIRLFGQRPPSMQTVTAIAPKPLHDMVVARLEGTWRDQVQEAVREQLECDRIDAEDARADMIRDRRMDL